MPDFVTVGYRELKELELWPLDFRMARLPTPLKAVQSQGNWIEKLRNGNFQEGIK